MVISSVSMKPKPFSALNHLTLPFCINLFLQFLGQLTVVHRISISPFPFYVNMFFWKQQKKFFRHCRQPSQIQRVCKCILSTKPSLTYPVFNPSLAHLTFLLTESQPSSKEILICKHCKQLIAICFSTSGEMLLSWYDRGDQRAKLFTQAPT